MPIDRQALVGQVLGGRYRLLRPIGAGGMGAVFEAEQLDLRRRVALKVLGDVGPEAVARLRQEAMTAGALQSPHVVAIFDFQDGDPPFLVMELLTGEPLSALLRSGVPLEPARAARIAVQMLAGLDAAHAVGITHRDVKPSNVWITRAGTGEEHVKLLDFGIAKVHDAPAGVRTATGHVLGTPLYMAPEQLRGERADARSDIHAVGVVLFEMLTGRRPFGTTSQGLLTEVLAHVPPPVRQLAPATPQAMSDAVARALSKDPAARFGRASEMAQALQSSLKGSWPATLVSRVAPADSSPDTVVSAGAAPANTNTFDVGVRSSSPHVAPPFGGGGPPMMAPLAHPVAVAPTVDATFPPRRTARPAFSTLGMVVVVLAGGLTTLFIGCAGLTIVLGVIGSGAASDEGSGPTASAGDAGATTADAGASAVPDAASTAAPRPTAPQVTPSLPAPPGAKPPPSSSPSAPAAPASPPTSPPPGSSPAGRPPRPSTFEPSQDFFVYSAHEQAMIRGLTPKIDACVAASSGHVEDEQIVVYVANPGAMRPPSFDVAVNGAAPSASFAPCVIAAFQGLGLAPRSQKMRFRIYFRL